MTCHICNRAQVRDYDREKWSDCIPSPTDIEPVQVFSGTERVFGCPECETDLSVNEWGAERFNYLAGLPQVVGA